MNDLISAAQTYDPSLLPELFQWIIGPPLLVFVLYVAIHMIREAIVMRGVEAIDRKEK